MAFGFVEYYSFTMVSVWRHIAVYRYEFSVLQQMGVYQGLRKEQPSFLKVKS